ncbi:PEP-CTERM sorting domain-containing protein [Acidobacteria bacterium AB60]|nr:PEP-CTERM sorting domain-containing protein [Acidobacteria bacterium AB60]
MKRPVLVFVLFVISAGFAHADAFTGTIVYTPGDSGPRRVTLSFSGDGFSLHSGNGNEVGSGGRLPSGPVTIDTGLFAEPNYWAMSVSGYPDAYAVGSNPRLLVDLRLLFSTVIPASDDPGFIDSNLITSAITGFLSGYASAIDRNDQSALYTIMINGVGEGTAYFQRAGDLVSFTRADFDINGDASVVPEPSTISLFLVGLAAVFLAFRRKISGRLARVDTI